MNKIILRLAIRVSSCEAATKLLEQIIYYDSYPKYIVIGTYIKHRVLDIYQINIKIKKKCIKKLKDG